VNDDRQDVWARVLADPSIYAQLFLANHDDLDYHSMPDPLLARIAVDVEPFFASSALAERAVRSSPELPSVCGRLLAESHDGFLLASALDHVPAATARGHIAAWLADPEPCHLGRATLFAAILAALLGPDGTLPADDPLSDRLRACLAAEPTEFLDQVRSRLEREHGLDLPRLELRR
jgi:hypothetical protein